MLTREPACIHCHDIKTSRAPAAGKKVANAHRATRKKLPSTPHPGD